MKLSPPPPSSATPSVSQGPVATTAIPSEALLAGRPEVAIEHQGQIYRLRQTAQGKLILTK
jgi:hemin uptake protein HemP